MRKCRERLERFLVDLMEPVGRSERRHWGSVYVRGLLLDGERKSIEPIAARLPEGNVQALQQFVGQSPWEWGPIWERLGKRMTAELEAEPAWVIDDTGFPKQGEHSVGVARQYSGTLGKTGNCQIAVSLHHVGENGSTALNWRLYLPEEWAEDSEKRQEAGIPEDVVFQTKWELALEMIDEVRRWGLPDRVVLGDAAYGEPTAFRQGLEKRELRYALGIQSNVGIWTKPPKRIQSKPAGMGRPRTAWNYGDQKPVSAKEAALKAKGWKTIRWREGSKGWLESRFWSARVQPSHRLSRRPASGKRSVAPGGMARIGARADQILPLQYACGYDAASVSPNHQMPVENRTRLSATQRGTRARIITKDEAGKGGTTMSLS